MASLFSPLQQPGAHTSYALKRGALKIFHDGRMGLPGLLKKTVSAIVRALVLLIVAFMVITLAVAMLTMFFLVTRNIFTLVP